MKNKILKNIPNILTGLRIILVVISFVLFLNDSFSTGIILLIIAAITDFLDGYFARKLNAITTFGAKLDQLSDKLFEILICFAGIIMGNRYLLITIILEAVFLFIIVAKSKRMINWKSSTKLGKIKTAALFLTIIFGIVVTRYKTLEIPFFIVWSITTFFQAYSNYENIINFKRILNINTNKISKK